MNEDKKLYEVEVVCNEHTGEDSEKFVVVAHFVKEAYDKVVEFLKIRDEEDPGLTMQDEKHDWDIVRVEFHGIVDIE